MELKHNFHEELRLCCFCFVVCFCLFACFLFGSGWVGAGGALPCLIRSPARLDCTVLRLVWQWTLWLSVGFIIKQHAPWTLGSTWGTWWRLWEWERRWPLRQMTTICLWLKHNVNRRFLLYYSSGGLGVGGEKGGSEGEREGRWWERRYGQKVREEGGGGGEKGGREGEREKGGGEREGMDRKWEKKRGGGG